MPKVNMVLRDPTRPVSVIHHGSETYKPNRKNVFEVEAAHVDELRSHGLMREGEQAELVDAKALIGDKDKLIAAQGKQLEEQGKAIETLQKQIAELAKK